MNDFAVLSLSDLLTERETILRRLEHIARSGMACALYNPQSKQRRDLIISARDCFRRERGDETVSAVVTHAGRTGETIWTGRLMDLPIEEISMSSIVLIGGEDARLIGKWLVEPRGYGNKTDFLPAGED
jgi:cobalt-precorrin 5A hydrolase/precorrin-3B C17-methyltransferase